MSLPPIDETHDPERPCWVAGAEGHETFPIQNLPLGVFSPPGGTPRVGTAIGEHILDLAACASLGLAPAVAATALGGTTLNALLALPPAERSALRRRLSDLLSDRAHQAALEPMLHPARDCALGLPTAIGDYTDFYAGIHHADHVGRLLRPDAPLLPNYKFVPIGYHGRASSVRPSGAPVRRPSGQSRPAGAETPLFGPSRRLDYELELAVWIGPGNGLGQPVPIGEASAHVAGFGLLNDWSARDLQGWEYQPLGPFLAKSFHTTVSPWIVTAEALAPFRTAQPPRPQGDPAPLPYLWDAADQAGGALGLELAVEITTPQMRAHGRAPHRLGQAPADALYWTVAQLLAHHTSNGCDLRPGDLLGTGTISGPGADACGSLLELTEAGQAPVTLPGGETRRFLEDGDEIDLVAFARRPGYRSIGFGPCRARVEAPA